MGVELYWFDIYEYGTEFKSIPIDSNNAHAVSTEYIIIQTFKERPNVDLTMEMILTNAQVIRVVQMVKILDAFRTPNQNQIPNTVNL